jgi:peptide/nickel transport system substrate-binding protein
MPDMIDEELGGLSWTKEELTRGRMSRREFVQLAMAAGLSVSAAQTLFTKVRAASPKKGGRLRVAISWGSTTNSLDPATYLDNYMFTIALTIGSLLAQVDERGNIGSDLAESFEPSSQAKVWRVALRKGVTFHDGKPLKPEDVIASIRHHMGAESKSAVKSVVSQIEDMKPDGNVVQFELKGETPISPMFSVSSD